MQEENNLGKKLGDIIDHAVKTVRENLDERDKEVGDWVYVWDIGTMSDMDDNPIDHIDIRTITQKKFMVVETGCKYDIQCNPILAMIGINQDLIIAADGIQYRVAESSVKLADHKSVENPALKESEIVKIFKENEGIIYDGNPLWGIQILFSYFPRPIEGAKNDILYGPSIEDLEKQHIKKKDAIELAKTGWYLYDELYLAYKLKTN